MIVVGLSQLKYSILILFYHYDLQTRKPGQCHRSAEQYSTSFSPSCFFENFCFPPINRRLPSCHNSPNVVESYFIA